jgi:hypothetical protein
MEVTRVHYWAEFADYAHPTQERELRFDADDDERAVAHAYGLLPQGFHLQWLVEEPSGRVVRASMVPLPETAVSLDRLIGELEATLDQLRHVQAQGAELVVNDADGQPIEGWVSLRWPRDPEWVRRQPRD